MCAEVASCMKQKGQTLLFHRMGETKGSDPFVSRLRKCGRAKRIELTRLQGRGFGMDFSVDEIFRVDECDSCGECLQRCPVLSYSGEEARNAIRGLIVGDPGSPVLKRCSTCMSCNIYCPHDCNPYGLILYRWFQRYRDRRVPLRSTLVMPLEPGNAWWNMKRWFPADEKSLLKEWSDLSRPEVREADEVMFAGCNLLSYPYMADGGIFSDLPVVGAEGLCCGEVYFRMGLLDAWERNARTLPDRVDLSLAVHEPCHAKTLGNSFMESPRELLKAVGGTPLEMEHHHASGLCCGFGCGASRYSPFDLVLGGIKRLREARGVGDGIMVYCNSCLLFLSMARLMYPGAPRIYHLVELLQQAAGSPTCRRHERRVLNFVTELTLGTPKMLSLKRVEV